MRIFENSEKWSLIKFGEIFTGGLHSNEWAASIEGFVKTQHKYEHNMLDAIDLVKKM